MSETFIKVKMVRSVIGQPEAQRRVLRGLGLRKMGAERTFKDTNCIRGMINKIPHMVTYQLLAAKENES